ncbi:MAG: pantoate--beta-alanine ligase [Planctomycetota bacterium]|jgi:pantoate--beta-alanine ligase
MRIAETVAELRTARRQLEGPVGFVPTMGALHDGHAALARECRSHCASTVASVFVNPAQFNDARDLEAYPRTLDADAEILAGIGCDVLFAPSVEEMYPDGFSTTIDIGRLGTLYEGAHRPDHFNGVCVVVAKLFSLVRPDRAYFGKKDAQQLAVIRHLCRDLGMGVEIVPVATVRDPDGLALSSRNRRLSPNGRIHALGISAGLQRGQQAWAAGERDAHKVAATARSEGLDYDYCACVDAATFGAPGPGAAALLIVAATVEGVRLIDNVELSA